LRTVPEQDFGGTAIRSNLVPKQIAEQENECEQHRDKKPDHPLGFF
jgi:hypothetical protein